MARYIDADKIDFSPLKDDFDRARAKVIIMGQPTADVVEVKHGEWVDNGIQDSMLSECSLCGFPCGAYTFNYCPNCGAKMSVNYKSSKNER
jgi:hypothetical protein